MTDDEAREACAVPLNAQPRGAAMTDDEVRAWLSPLERGAYHDALERPRPGSTPVVSLTRALAETRKALVACEWGGSETGVHCDVCGAHPDRSEKATHKPTCILATMPRPR